MANAGHISFEAYADFKIMIISRRNYIADTESLASNITAYYKSCYHLIDIAD